MSFLNTLNNEDCLMTMNKMPPDFVDLTVTSPPYNVGIKYEGYDDNLTWVKYYNWCREWLTALYRVTKDDGRVCLNHYFSMGQSANRHAPLMKLNEMAEGIGFKHHGVAFWMDRTLTKRTAWGSWLSASAPYVNSPLEGILILYKNKWKKEKKGVTNITKKEFMEACSGIWELPTERKRDHPAPFPESLARRCILLFSYEGDVVYDPFMGGGTTIKVAKENNRNYIGSEISKVYCDMARVKINAGALT